MVEERTGSTVYVVTEGCYSDYQVHCAFATEEDAREAVALGAGDDVHELRVYGPGERPKQTVTAWNVSAYLFDVGLGVDGPMFRAETHWDWLGEPAFGPDRPAVTEHWYPDSTYNKARWGVFARCRDRELALKAVHDRIAVLKARREGVA